jgi:predicted O-linked N-acetylglucosamine transferase (SPINDLY family)
MDALWMGVPLITLAGTTAVGGGGKFLLANLGLDELIAHNPEEYVSKAVELARDLPRLKQLRATLRQRMERSPLMDAPTYARNIEAAYRQMWRAYFEGL